MYDVVVYKTQSIARLKKATDFYPTGALQAGELVANLSLEVAPQAYAQEAYRLFFDLVL